MMSIYSSVVWNGNDPELKEERKYKDSAAWLQKCFFPKKSVCLILMNDIG